jgi:hypothetical protein
MELARYMTPCSTANLINMATFFTPSLSIVLRRCTSTVRTLIRSRSRMCGVERPLETSEPATLAWQVAACQAQNVVSL